MKMKKEIGVMLLPKQTKTASKPPEARSEVQADSSSEPQGEPTALTQTLD